MGLAVTPIRRRRLFVDDSGLVAVRNGYRLCATWDDVAGFHSGRFALMFPVTIMRLHRSRIERLDEGVVSEELRGKIEKHGAIEAFKSVSMWRIRRGGHLVTSCSPTAPDLSASLGQS